MEKINVAELLKDCPKGMEVDCTMYDNCTFDGLEDVGYVSILVKTPNGLIKLTKNGCYIWGDDYAKCVIFPKGKTTWEGFQRPFKDGDVISSGAFIAIFHKVDKGHMYYHCWFNSIYNEFKAKIDFGIGYVEDYENASKEEKQKLFDAIKANGYKWNAETKNLEKLIVPKFKVGDKIRHKTTNKDYIYEISKVYDDSYGLVDINWTIYMTYQDHYELVPNKFDITTLMPFDKVLVAHKKGEWHIQFFEKYSPTSKFPFICIGGSAYQRCIPYGVNKHLMGTTNDCEEYFKIWEN